MSVVPPAGDRTFKMAALLLLGWGARARRHRITATLLLVMLPPAARQNAANTRVCRHKTYEAKLREFDAKCSELNAFAVQRFDEFYFLIKYRTVLDFAAQCPWFGGKGGRL